MTSGPIVATAVPVIRLQENAPWRETELSTAHATMLSASQIVRVAPGARPGLWLIRDNGLVGAARLGPASDPVEIRIGPKTPVDRLLFLLGYATRPGDWRRGEVDAGEHKDLLPALAYAFARSAERALSRGVLLGYRETEETMTVVRGRIRHAEQIRCRYSLPLPLEIRYDDYTVDIQENRLLLAAVHRLLRLPGVRPAIRALLRHLLVRLDGVSRLAPGMPPPRWTPSRLNARYAGALGLAEVILRGASYELDDGMSVRVDGLLLRMWRVFEDFVTVALAEALRPYGGRVALQDRAHHLDDARRVRLKPDLVHYAADGRPNAVVDAKYKIERSAEAHHADLYQMLAYCTVLGLRRGHLIYAAGETGSMTHVVRQAGVEIVCAVLDLRGTPGELLAGIAALAADLSAEHERDEADGRDGADE